MTWRIRSWPYDPTVALIIFVDLTTTPSDGQIDAAIAAARRRGARLARTSAVTLDTASALDGHGFEIIDRLALLQTDLTAAPPAAHARIRHLRRSHYGLAAEVDLAAFGPRWGQDVSSLVDIGTSTTWHRARWISQDHQWTREMAGFAISGAAGSVGYLQRLAVHPDAQRHGYGRDLTLDSLAWMRSMGATTALVNTGITNSPALALYERLGFERLADDLIVAEIDLRTT